MQRTDRNLAKGTADLDPVEKLTHAAWILAAEGHSGSLAGQITARVVTTAHFLTLALGVGFDEACPADFIRIDDDLNVIDGKGVSNPATRFHLWIYRHRPHVQAIIHTYPPAVSALSLLGTWSFGNLLRLGHASVIGHGSHLKISSKNSPCVKVDFKL